VVAGSKLKLPLCTSGVIAGSGAIAMLMGYCKHTWNQGHILVGNRSLQHTDCCALGQSISMA
jgi:hypothetical protein